MNLEAAFVTIVILLKFRSATSNCIIYGVCYDEDDVHKPCLYDGSPIPLTNETGIELLAKLCPYLSEYATGQGLCCNDEQLTTLESQMQSMDAVFSRCPSCAYNIKLEMCHFTCSPFQSDYMQVEAFSLNDQTLERYATAVKAYVTSDYMDTTFESCANVALPSAGTKAMDSACGKYTAETCTADRWFEYLGNPTENPYAPFEVDVVRQDTDFLKYKPFNLTTYTCNEAPSNSSAACSCIDCPTSCPSGWTYPDLTSEFKVGSVSGYGVISWSLYGLGIIIYAVYKLRKYCKRANVEEDDISFNISQDDEPPQFNWVDNLSDKLMIYLENMFYHFTKEIASHPTLVLAVASWVIAFCAYGLQYMDITTDPIKIWSSATSESRIEKDYFDTRFGPFYRTEQIYLTAEGLDEIVHVTSSGNITFGPVFHKKFLIDVYNLQEEIYDIPGLIDLCYAPMSTTSTAETLSQCTVESVWGYFQNDMSYFNETSTDSDNITTNYLDVIYECLQWSLHLIYYAHTPMNMEILVQ